LSLIVRFRFGPVVRAFVAFLAASLWSRTVLQLEILALRHQIGVLQRSVKRPKLNPADRLLWAWGAPHIHGELLKLGIHIGETSVSKYMVRRRKPPSQTWRTFLDNHLKSMVSVDFFTVPTIRFQIL
jgi:hypothetical protein